MSSGSSGNDHDEVDLAVEQLPRAVEPRRCDALVLDELVDLVGVALDLVEQRAALRRDEQRAQLRRLVAVAEAEQRHDQERPDHERQQQAGLAQDVDGLLAEERADLERVAGTRLGASCSRVRSSAGVSRSISWTNISSNVGLVRLDRC